MRSYTFRTWEGDEVLVTVWDRADVITAVLNPPDPAPEVAIRPQGARTWGAPLRLVAIDGDPPTSRA